MLLLPGFGNNEAVIVVDPLGTTAPTGYDHHPSWFGNLKRFK
jgi:hypothetical protein